MTTSDDRSLDEWLSYIDTVHPVGWDLGLERVHKVGARLDVLHPAPITILVAGTNGKGSTCEYLAAFAAAEGLSCGKSTSPHLFRFNERIVIDGQPVSDEQIIAAFEQIEAARGDITLTYFEFASLASMQLFKSHTVDVAVLEVGLGGRLDAMNIVEPDLSIITSIALDHQGWLGDTREQIALEKAGIMRADVTCVIADRNPPSTLASHAESTGAPVCFIGRDFDLPEGIKATSLPPDSFAVAFEAAGQLDWMRTTAIDIAASTALAGRRTWIEGQPSVLLDVAHNPAAAISLAGYLEEQTLRGDIHALLGIYADKDIESVTGALAPYIKTWHLTAMEEARAASTDEIEDRLADQVRGNSTAYVKIPDAVTGILSRAKAEDLILVFGSFPVVAGGLQHFQSTNRT